MSGLILIVEDEPDLVAVLEHALSREGFATRAVHTGREALELATADTPLDLVLLDLMLPDMQGTEVCRRLRADPRTRALPIIIMTARTDEIDRIVGFELGADDYVTKPFSVRELALRCRAVMRRGGLPPPQPTARQHGRLRVDREGHRVWVDDVEVTLTALEFRLLTTLVERAGRVQTREALLSAVWGARPDLTTRTVDTHVQRLRDKLGVVGECVRTLRGVGYVFSVDSPEGEGGS